MAASYFPASGGTDYGCKYHAQFPACTRHRADCRVIHAAADSSEVVVGLYICELNARQHVTYRESRRASTDKRARRRGSALLPKQIRERTQAMPDTRVRVCVCTRAQDGVCVCVCVYVRRTEYR